MEKALTLVVLIVTPSILFAQGTVDFVNFTTGLVQQWTSASDPTLASVPVGGGYVVARRQTVDWSGPYMKAEVAK
jgi:hypothetical protein